MPLNTWSATCPASHSPQKLAAIVASLRQGCQELLSEAASRGLQAAKGQKEISMPPCTNLLHWSNGLIDIVYAANQTHQA